MTTTTLDMAAVASIEAAARELKLAIVRTDATRARRRHRTIEVDYLGCLAEILEAEGEVDARTERRRARRVHDAKFPRVKRLADLDLDAALPSPAVIATLTVGAATSAPATPSSCSATPAPASRIYSSGSASPPATPACASVTSPPRSSPTSSPKPPTNVAWPASSAAYGRLDLLCLA